MILKHFFKYVVCRKKVESTVIWVTCICSSWDAEYPYKKSYNWRSFGIHPSVEPSYSMQTNYLNKFWNLSTSAQEAINAQLLSLFIVAMYECDYTYPKLLGIIHSFPFHYDSAWTQSLAKCWHILSHIHLHVSRCIWKVDQLSDILPVYNCKRKMWNCAKPYSELYCKGKPPPHHIATKF